MDLGIEGRWALVCAASKGLGLACARALVREGVHVVVTARGEAALQASAAALRALDPTVQVRAVAGDITTPEGRSAALAAAPQIDILVNNAGGPPPGDFRDWSREDWMRAVDANMLTPIELIKACVDSMAERRFGRIVNITSGAVKAPIDVLGLSNGARSGLTGFIAGLARSPRLASANVTINNLLPGAFDTDRLQATLAGAARKAGTSLEQAADARRRQCPAGRFGEPDEFGALCAYLCSAGAGFVTGQNILIDGGAYPGTY
ncbi:MAG: SDR family oxidoreductase [Burkholderiales bacterium]|nr:SDR family oxidoreductase [Burkholderiales bacterium]MDE2159890.1 SDR family oxidoreductase [Burkholderiales bacterium]